MKYGAIGGFVQFAFAKTAFDYIEKVLPQSREKARSHKKKSLTARDRLHKSEKIRNNLRGRD